MDKKTGRTHLLLRRMGSDETVHGTVSCDGWGDSLGGEGRECSTNVFYFPVLGRLLLLTLLQIGEQTQRGLVRVVFGERTKFFWSESECVATEARCQGSIPKKTKKEGKIA